jgi:cell division protein FtsL
MSEKKVVGRNVAIGIGIICIILAVGLVGVIANYTSMINGKDNTIASKDSQIGSLNSQITDKDNTISSLNSQIVTKDNTISSLNSQITSKDSQISSLNSQGSSLQSQVDNLNGIVNLAKSTVWKNGETISQPASSYTHWTPAFSASYAGYVSVWVQTSTTTNTYVRVIYTAYGVNYDQQINVGTSGTAVFPLLPCSNIDIRVGNSNLMNGATETVTITYHY